MTNHRQRLDLARSAARQAGLLTLDFFRKDIAVQRKADNSPVTDADRGAEQLIRRLISEKFPEDAILGEEFPEKPGNSGYRWILDPIDGTKSFITGVPLYGTMIGVEFQDKPLIGVVDFPALDQRIFACIGGGAWVVQGDEVPFPARVGLFTSLGEGTFLTSQVDTFDRRGAADAFKRLEKIAYITRTWGDCYGYFLVATGRAVAMVDPELNVWDAAALLPIMVESGGVFTDWRGEPDIRSGDAVGTNPTVLPEVLAILGDFVR